MLFRPSLPWCFPIREVPFEQKESQEQEQQQQQEETGGTSIVSAAARSYIREFLGAFLMLFRPSLPWCFGVLVAKNACQGLFLHPGGAFWTEGVAGAGAAAAGGNRRKKYSFSSSCHGVFPSGRFLLQQQQQQEATGGKSSYKQPFLWVSEVTLGSFWAQFWCFSVLRCHGVFPSGRCILNRRSRRSRSSSSSSRMKQEEKV